jgi:tight adherence protein C
MMERDLPFAAAIGDPIALLAGIAAFLVVIGVWRALLARGPQGLRMQALAGRRRQLWGDLLAPARRREVRVPSRLMGRVVERFKLLSSRYAKDSALRLARAGYRSKEALIAYLFARVCAPIAGGVAVLLALYAFPIFDLAPMLRLAVALMGTLAFAHMPDLFLRNAADRRRRSLRKELPDALDLLVICAEAGLGADAAFVRVTRELADANSAIADELALTSIELGFLPDRHQALENLNRRTDLPEIRGLVNTLVQADRYGTPVARSLRVLAAEFRSERLLRAEAKAARLPAILTVPMIVFILPALFIVLIGPAVLDTLDGLMGFAG